MLIKGESTLTHPGFSLKTIFFSVWLHGAQTILASILLEMDPMVRPTTTSTSCSTITTTTATTV